LCDASIEKSTHGPRELSV